MTTPRTPQEHIEAARKIARKAKDMFSPGGAA